MRVPAKGKEGEREGECSRVENKNVGGCVRQLTASRSFFAALLTRLDTFLCAHADGRVACAAAEAAHFRTQHAISYVSSMCSA